MTITNSDPFIFTHKISSNIIYDEHSQGLGRKLRIEREGEGLNGIRFESLFGVRPRSLAQIAGITYARRSPRFALTPELYFPIIFVGIIIRIILTTLDSKLYLLAVQNIFPLTGKTHARRYSSLSFSSRMHGSQVHSV